MATAPSRRTSSRASSGGWVLLLNTSGRRLDVWPRAPRHFRPRNADGRPGGRPAGPEGRPPCPAFGGEPRCLEAELPDEALELLGGAGELLGRRRDLLRRGARLLRGRRDLLRGGRGLLGDRGDL